jgi:hypothetical protein
VAFTLMRVCPVPGAGLPDDHLGMVAAHAFDCVSHVTVCESNAGVPNAEHLVRLIGSYGPPPPNRSSPRSHAAAWRSKINQFRD